MHSKENSLICFEIMSRKQERTRLDTKIDPLRQELAMMAAKQSVSQAITPSLAKTGRQSTHFWREMRKWRLTVFEVSLQVALQPMFRF